MVMRHNGVGAEHAYAIADELLAVRDERAST
jgi:hypothetical protein